MTAQRFSGWFPWKVAAAVGIPLLAAVGVYAAVSSAGPNQPPALPPGTYVAGEHTPQQKPATTTLSEGPVETTAPEPTLAPVPASSVPPAGVACPPGWLFFDNPVVHYSLCYPSGWGISDFSTPNPLDTIPRKALGDVYILSPEAFPNPVGVDFARSPPDVQARLKEAITIDVSVFPPGVSSQGCKPSMPVVMSGVRGVECEDTYDILPGPEVQFSPNGSLHTLVIWLPLNRLPEPDPAVPRSVLQEQPSSGFQLAINVTGPVARHFDQGSVPWQVLDTIRVY